jgi:hypothetical protein
MRVSRRTLVAENRELRARIERLTEQRHDDRDDTETERGARKEAERLVAELRGKLRTLTARHEALQRRYDAAVGMDDPQVAAGRDWQSRRADRPGPGKTAPSTPSAPLPVREPGEVAS